METKVKFLSNLMLIVCVFSCNNEKRTNEIGQLKTINKWYLGMKDTVLIDNIGDNHIKYKFYGDSLYSIEWGNSSLNNKSQSNFEVQGNGILNVLDYNKEFILLSQSCGGNCLQYVFLPLKNNIHEKIYLFAKAYDLKDNLIAFIPAENAFICIANISTGQVMNIKEDNLCDASFKGDCIDSIYFKEHSVIIKWQGRKSESDKPDSIEKIIPILF